MKTVEIAPITRIEGQAKVSVFLNDDNKVDNALFQVLEFRGFEKFMEGRMIWEAPRIATRICGICPVSHHLAATKAIEAGLNITAPPTAVLLRELMHMAQIIHSHSLHFFFLAYPDYAIGVLGAPEKRNFLGLLENNPELVKKALIIRKTGQTIIERLGGKAIHPVSSLPGGMSKGITEEERQEMLKEIDIVLKHLQEILPIALAKFDEYHELVTTFAEVQTGFLGTVDHGTSSLYDGKLRFKDSSGEILDEFNVSQYQNFFREATQPWTYLKFPYYSALSKENGIFQVGPLARLNVADRLMTPLAQEAFAAFQEKYGSPAQSPILHNLARFIEILEAAERAKELLEDNIITGTKTRIKVAKKAGEGIGLLEAPRGSLIHHYKWDKDGRINMANLIVATVFNNPAMNLSVKHAAEQCQGTDGKFDSSLLNLVEVAIRAFDPCLTCASHSLFSESNSFIDVFDSSGQPFQRVTRFPRK